MELKTVPALLNIPMKLRPLIGPDFNRYRYWMLHGGRGGGKSNACSRFILFLADRYHLRIVVGREIQQNISESLHALFSDLILANNLNFEIQATKITHRVTQSTINFRGLRDQGKFGLQGLEGCDIFFCDEAQTLTKETLDILIPTIRKDSARIIFSLNRHVPLDPVYEMFIGRSDCKTIHINFNENNFCPESLKHEAEQCRKLSEADYRHIWLGEPQNQLEDSVYSVSELSEAKTKDFKLEYGFGERVAGFDIARMGDDKNAVVILEQMGLLRWKMIYSTEWGQQDLNWTTGKILEIVNEFGVSRAAVDIDGLGAGPFDTLSHSNRSEIFYGFSNVKIDHREFCNRRTLYAYKLKDLLRNGHLALTNEKLISELLSIKYGFDNSQRRILISKDQMRKQGVKSPNLADAAIMAASMVAETKEKQERPYQANRMPQYSAEEDLFKIAGIF